MLKDPYSEIQVDRLMVMTKTNCSRHVYIDQEQSEKQNSKTMSDWWKKVTTKLENMKT